MISLSSYIIIKTIAFTSKKKPQYSQSSSDIFIEYKIIHFGTKKSLLFLGIVPNTSFSEFLSIVDSKHVSRSQDPYVRTMMELRIVLHGVHWTWQIHRSFQLLSEEITCQVVGSYLTQNSVVIMKLCSLLNDPKPT
jgi:hypothetical protein